MRTNSLKLIPILFIFSIFLMSSCKDKKVSEEQEIDQYIDLEATTCPYGLAPSQWNYENQEEWDNICKNSACGDTRYGQSPIIINDSSVTRNNTMQLEIDWKNYNVTVQDLPYTVQGQYRDNFNKSGLKWTTTGGVKKEYILMSFHVHTPCEHKYISNITKDTVLQPLEMHLVHVNRKDPNDKLVLAILYTITSVAGSENNLPLEEFANCPSGTKMKDYNVSGLLPFNKSFWHYTGSLTTPDCNANITWIVMRGQGIYQSTIDKFKKRYEVTVPNSNNARKPQLNNNTVYFKYIKT